VKDRLVVSVLRQRELERVVHWLVIGLSLGSALSSSISTTLKKAAASRVPAVFGGGLGGLGGLARFARATVANPLWLTALLADFGGVGLQVTALHFGALALVQPLLVSGLLFALLLRHLGSWSITWQEVGWAVLLTGCLIGFLGLSGAVTGSQSAHADRGAAVIATIATSVAVLLCLVVAQRQVPPAGRAALIGAAVGAIYATTAALIKSATGLLAEHGLLALLGSWQLYTALVVAAGGLFLAQVAFQAGPLTASLPAISTIDPLLSVLIGVLIYDEHLRRGPGSGAVLLTLMILLVIAVIGLGRVETTSEPHPHGEPGP
jgi:uncharacterized membrane protein YobD (UPF0266 family)